MWEPAAKHFVKLCIKPSLLERVWKFLTVFEIFFCRYNFQFFQQNGFFFNKIKLLVKSRATFVLYTRFSEINLLVTFFYSSNNIQTIQFFFCFRPKSQAYESRLQQVQNDIDSTNSYHLTETELIYGAKLAWRNSARCIGRIQWSKLQVFIIEKDVF